ncbi:hypothetical protein Z945_576 [Sulfitobacter noctilucae]|nr:hypothetical protein Z945_576 [Sulfitobacter noctilucae]
MQPLLGILMLDTRFPRIIGDVGNPDTWPFPVRYGVVAGATPQAIVCADMTPFVEAFISQGHALVREGCIGIATTCGFLSLMRPQLATALGVPVAASALEQAGQIIPMLAHGKRLGVLTISAESLSDAHLAAAGVPLETPVAGMEGSSLAASILGNKPTLDVRAARTEMIRAAEKLISLHDDIGALILECTNMVPYAADVARATGIPVFSIYTYLRWFHAGLAPRQF